MPSGFNPLDKQQHDEDTDCIECASGRYNDKTGQTSDASCKLCGAGSVTDTLLEGGGTTCLQCLAGFHSHVAHVACIGCEAGRYSNVPGNTNRTDCRECESGSATNTLNNVGAHTCRKCPVGHFSEYPQNGCAGCKQGRYADKTGTKLCTLCQKGSYGNFGMQTSAASCRSCPDGRYSNEGTARIEDCVVSESLLGSSYPTPNGGLLLPTTFPTPFPSTTASSLVSGTKVNYRYSNVWYSGEIYFVRSDGTYEIIHKNTKITVQSQDISGYSRIEADGDLDWWHWLLIAIAALTLLGCCCGFLSWMSKRPAKNQLNSTQYSTTGHLDRSGSFHSVPVEKSVIYGQQQQEFSNVIVGSPQKLVNSTVMVGTPQVVSNSNLYASPARNYAYAQDGTAQMIMGGSAVERQVQAYNAARSPAVPMGNIGKMLLSSPVQTMQQQGVVYQQQQQPAQRQVVTYSTGGGLVNGTPVRGPSMVNKSYDTNTENRSSHMRKFLIFSFSLISHIHTIIRLIFLAYLYIVDCCSGVTGSSESVQCLELQIITL